MTHKIIPSKLHNPTERVLVSISPANLNTKPDGTITLKDSPRLRLLIDAKLFEEQGFVCDRLQVVRFDEDAMGIVFRVSDVGRRAAPIKKGSGRLDYSVPLNHKVLEKLDANAFPRLSKQQCSHCFPKDDLFAVKLPLESIKE